MKRIAYFLLLSATIRSFSSANRPKYHVIRTSSNAVSVPRVAKIVNDDGTYTTVVNGKVYKNRQVVYRLPPRTKYELRGRIIYANGRPAYNVKNGYQYAESYRKPKRPKPTSENLLHVFNSKPVQVRNGQIFIDGVLAYEDENLKNGIVRINSKKGNLYVNGKMVMKRNPRKPNVVVPRGVNIDLRGVTQFQLKMRKNRILWYKDANGHEKTFVNG